MRPDGTVKVYLEQPDTQLGFRHATCILPSYTWEDIVGFAPAEIDRYQEVIESTAHLILEFSQTTPVFRNAPCGILCRSSRLAVKRSFRNGRAFLARLGIIVEAFLGIFRPFRLQKIPIAPNQHHFFVGWLEELGNTAPSPLSLAFFHIHSKTAC